MVMSPYKKCAEYFLHFRDEQTEVQIDEVVFSKSFRLTPFGIWTQIWWTIRPLFSHHISYKYLQQKKHGEREEFIRLFCLSSPFLFQDFLKRYILSTPVQFIRSYKPTNIPKLPSLALVKVAPEFFDFESQNLNNDILCHVFPFFKKVLFGNT